MSFRSLLDRTVDIKRQVLTADEQGGYTETWTTVYRRVPCRFNSLLARETTLTYDKQSVFANYNVYMEFIGVTEGDRLHLGSRIFEVKLICDWDEKNNMLKLAVMELDRV